MTKATKHTVDWATVLLLGLIFGLAVIGYFDRQQQLERNCRTIEELKTTLRLPAEATVKGNQALLDDHDLNGTPLPVPRAAIEADMAEKQRVVDRTQPRKC